MNTEYYESIFNEDKDAVENGLRIVQNAGVDFTFNASDINKMPNEKY